MAEENDIKYQKVYDSHKKAHHTADTIFSTTEANASKAFLYAVKGDDKDKGVLIDKKGRLDYDLWDGKKIVKAGERFRKFLLKQIESDLGLKEGYLNSKKEYEGLALNGFYNITEEGFKQMADQHGKNFKLKTFEDERDNFLKIIEHTLYSSARSHLHDAHRENKDALRGDLLKYTGAGSHLENKDMPIEVLDHLLNNYHNRIERKLKNPNLTESDVKGIFKGLNKGSKENKFSGLEKLLLKKKKK